MKNKIRFFLALLLAAVLLLGLTACGSAVARANNLSASYKRKTGESGEVTARFSAAYADFSFSLFEEVLNESAAGSNKLLSPLSAAECLALAMNGAGGETKAEMEAVLGLPAEELNKALYAFQNSLAQGKKEKALLANSVWFRKDDGLQVKEDFLQTLADWYQAEAYAEPFDEGTVRRVNKWCSDHTDGMIREMVPAVSKEDMLYLLNALVFDAEWQKPYEKEQIYEESFRNADGSESRVNMLHSEEKIYLSFAGGYGVAKPYVDDHYYFVGLLPEDKEQGIYDFASSLSGEIWLAAWAGRSREEVAAKIPEFKTTDDTDLAMVLRNMGMKTMFDDGKADFRAMAEYAKGNIVVSGVQQKTFLELDRSGTKAAAVTGMTMAAQSAAPLEPKTVYLDRPFVYMIIDGATGLPLFTGVTGEIKP